LRQMCVRYTARCKHGLLTAAERLQHEKGMTLRKAAEELLIAHSLIVKWKKQQRAAGEACPIMAMIKTKKKAAHAGPLGQLKSIEQDHTILSTVSRGLR
jgi:transposase